MSGESFYDILHVSRNASDDEIKKSYKKLAMKWHPDKNPANVEEATEMFKKIAEAYDTLSDSQKRREYDDFLMGAGSTSSKDSGGYRRPRYEHHPFDERHAFDIFEQFFASFHEDFFGDPFFERHFQEHYGGRGESNGRGRGGRRADPMDEFFGGDPFGGFGGLRGGRRGVGGFGFGPSLMDDFFGGDPFHREVFSQAGGGGGRTMSTSFSSSSSRISMGGGGGGRSVSTSSYTDRNGRTVTRKETTIYHPDGTSETSVEEYTEEAGMGRLEDVSRGGLSNNRLLIDRRGGGGGLSRNERGRDRVHEEAITRMSSDPVGPRGDRKRSGGPSSGATGAANSRSDTSKFGRMFSFH